jgi:hypothetical protein
MSEDATVRWLRLHARRRQFIIHGYEGNYPYGSALEGL